MRSKKDGKEQNIHKRKNDSKLKLWAMDAIDACRSTFAECDRMVILLVMGLSIFGVIMVFSAGFYQTVNLSEPDTYYYLRKQGFYALTGFILMMICSKIDYHKYERFYKVIIYISIGLLVLILTPLGITVNGATRWIYVGVTITPSEISKIAVIIYTSVFLARDPKAVKRVRGRGLLLLLAVMLIHLILIIKQPNLSTAIVIAVIMVAIAITAGLNLWYILALGGAGVAGIAAILIFGKSTHWYARLTSFVDPFADAQGDGYQVSQGLIALGNGGLKGLGFGNSIAKTLYLPEPQNDFILAIIGEELGYIGFLLLMAAYLLLLYHCIMVALKAKDRLGFYMATGISVMLALHIIINVAVVTASMPATGITLPFVSYGGTSMWMFMIGMGILLNISRGQKQTLLFNMKINIDGKSKRRKRRNSDKNREVQA